MTGADVLSGRLPWWVRGIALVGVPSLVSMFLVLWMTRTYDGRLQELRAAQQHQQEQIAATLTAMSTASVSMHEFALEMRQAIKDASGDRAHERVILRQICTAVSEGRALALCSQ